MKKSLVRLVVMFVVAVLGVVQPASAETRTYRVEQIFAYDSSDYDYKILLKDQEGTIFFLWYADPIELEVGQDVFITCSGYSISYGDIINNPVNGKQSKIWKKEVIKN